MNSFTYIKTIFTSAKKCVADDRYYIVITLQYSNPSQTYFLNFDFLFFFDFLSVSMSVLYPRPLPRLERRNSDERLGSRTKLSDVGCSEDGV